MKSSHLTTRLTWVVFLFYSPFLLLRWQVNVMYLAAEILTILCYCLFLSFRLEVKSREHPQARKIHAWITKNGNVEELTRRSINTLKNILFKTIPLIVVIALLTMEIDSLNNLELLHVLRVLFSFVWGCSLIITLMFIWNSSSEK